MIGNEFLRLAKLVTFSGPISYNSNGYAVLPSYTTKMIRANLQPLSKSRIQFQKEGTRYTDAYQFLSDFFVRVDTARATLGQYFIFPDNNYVLKVLSNNDYLPFGYLAMRHCEGEVVRDNRLTYDGVTLSLPYPQIEGPYAPLFDLITVAINSIQSITLTAIWAAQQELQPPLPYCAVSIERIDNTEIGNYTDLQPTFPVSRVTNTWRVLHVRYAFYSFDQISALNLLEEFKLNFPANNLQSNVLVISSLEDGSDVVIEKLYDDRTVFVAECVLKYNWIVQSVSTDPSSTYTIESVAFSLNVPPVN